MLLDYACTHTPKPADVKTEEGKAIAANNRALKSKLEDCRQQIKEKEAELAAIQKALEEEQAAQAKAQEAEQVSSTHRTQAAS